MWNENTFAKFVYLDDVRISWNGEKVAYTLTKANLDKNRYESTVVIEDLKDGSKRFVQDASMPRLSPDGKKLAVVKKGKDKESEIWLVDLDSMSEMRIATLKNVIDVLWNADGRKIAILTYRRREDEDLYFDDDVPVWFDAMGFLDGEKRKVLVYDTLAMEVLEEIELDKFSRVIWHSDSLVITSPHREDGKMNLWKNDVFLYEKGEKKPLFENVSLYAVHSNGELLVLLGKKEKKNVFEHDYVHIWDGKGLENLTEKFGVNGADAKVDSSGNVYHLAYEKGKMTISRISDEREYIFSENAFVTSMDVSSDGKVVFLAQDETRPNELYIWDGELRKLTDYNSEVLKVVPTRKAKHFTFENLGFEIDGWYLKPDTEEKAPVVVFVHGGPKGMYGHRFVYMMQHLVDEGFYVLYFNPRGSDGYSEDFALKVVGRTGKEDFSDIMKGIEVFLEIEKNADPERIGITGISYGGFMTNWAVTQTDRFKAAVSENGVSDWRSMYGFSDISLWFVKDLIGENPLENDIYEELSPLYHVKNVKTPILIIHSLEDYRCPLDQSVMFYHALKDLGKEAYIAIFKKGAHGHSLRASPKHRAKRHKMIVEFFKRKLKEGKEGFPLEEILKPQKSS